MEKLGVGIFLGFFTTILFFLTTPVFSDEEFSISADYPSCTEPLDTHFSVNLSGNIPNKKFAESVIQIIISHGGNTVSELSIPPNDDLSYSVDVELECLYESWEFPMVYTVAAEFEGKTANATFLVDLIELSIEPKFAYTEPDYTFGETLHASGAIPAQSEDEGVKIELRDPTGKVLFHQELEPLENMFSFDYTFDDENLIEGQYSITARYSAVGDWNDTVYFFLNVPIIDTDVDGLSDKEEEKLGTNLTKIDTDEDGLTDGDEIQTHLTNPLKPDTDGDGLTDGDEIQTHLTNPLKPDTDGDGLSDKFEIEKLGSNPLEVDSDTDGILDGEEDIDNDGLSNTLEVNYGTDVFNPDTDQDRISDGDEISLGSNPKNKDTDSDGIDDGSEREDGTNILETDTDGDGLADGDERYIGTNPLISDTDGDGTSDGDERNNGTDPLVSELDGILNEPNPVLPEVSAPTKIPVWVKNTAGWWANGNIDDNSFVQGIEFIIKEGIMTIPPTNQGLSSGGNEIPEWIKNNAMWWAQGMIEDSDFVQGIQFLINKGIMNLS